ncbi:uncharacterized protein MELLADRAFT_50439 [Melampsora larici-populina 98AG31]|uniref:Dolichyl-diphosphooligosaccharide--protein glycosyltransferase subunit WBP1 n=1 Tax=Melampsora larici-populina (strain 98AG31 / pathotype 3-4-7) TaxID=747676 RepID=F4S4U7_MELLP|nr:uncharacterized protein MELLADRAFT_50439 [Melampsora larici-populina 98AG31]EGG00351.1 hypothetical protein MELLADRAFT_50439 [Melampsora larici-populina 98AG31]
MISLLLITIALLKLVSADNILVVIEDSFKQNDYSRFWSSIQSRGHQLSFRAAKESSPQLYEHDQISFQHLIIFAPTTKSFAEDLSPQRLVQFLEDGGNILVGASSNLSEFWRDFGREFDIDFDHKASAVFDHFSHIGQDSATVVTSLERGPLIDDQVIIPQSTRSSSASNVIFRGIGHSVGKNPLLISVLRASPVAYSADAELKDPADTDPFITGEEIGLITGFQTHKQSRILFVGSVEFFSNTFGETEIQAPDGKKSQAANSKVSAELAAWVFQNSAVLRILSSTHRKVNGVEKPERYCINDQIEYKVDVQALNNGEWGPYSVTDMQLDFTMLDPHLRMSLKPTNSRHGNYTTYSSVFRAPDRHGVFTFRVDYRRRNGMSHLKDTLQVMVTPPDHDQHPRFLSDAYPYYVGSLNVLVGFVLFSAVWLKHVPGGSKKAQ